MHMRRTLLDKCEQVINKGAAFMSQDENKDLRTGKIFMDLLQFHMSETAQTIGVASPSPSASFMPAISQRTIKIDRTRHDLSVHMNAAEK